VQIYIDLMVNHAKAKLSAIHKLKTKLVYFTLLPFSLFVSSQAFAIPVTFSVDMAGVELNSQSVRVAGGFGGPCNWDANCYEMTKNPDNDIWTTQIDLNSGFYPYKFVIGNWNDQEYPPSNCATTGEFINRGFELFNALVLPTTPFDGCPGMEAIGNLPVDPNKQPVDSTKWHHQTQLPNGYSWYNDEQQHYTNDTENSYTSDGTLKIVAKKESYSDQGHTKPYTSARLNSKFAFKYGKVEFSAKMPSGVGTWPAVWMLNKNVNEPGGYFIDNFGTTNWPAAGEIDILEHWGKNPYYAQSAMHTPSSYGGTINHGGRTIPTIFSEFHTYTMDWNQDRIVFAIDGQVHYTYNPGIKNAETWPYDDEFYLLLNIAIEKPEVTASNLNFALMEVDYIRVYHHETDALIWSDEFDSNDNSGGNTQPLTAPEPTADVADVLSIFGTTYGNLAGTNFDPNWNQATDAVAGDEYVLNNLNYQGIAFDAGALDVSNYDYIHLDYYTDNSTAANFFLISPGPVETAFALNLSTKGQWNSVDIPLTAFTGVDLTDVFQMKFDGDGTLRIDNIYFGSLPVDDSDGDGVADDSDAFPNDASETTDTDNDGTGDNADAFPNDASETIDSDNDGTGDNADDFPNDASEITDSDNDGTGDNADAFPNDASETIDSDNDGTGDNADDFPNDASEITDSDNDGVGDNADYAPNDPTVQSAPTPEQQISVSGTTIASRGGSFSLDITYDVSSNENQLSGLGLRIHYDSTKLEFTGVNNPLLTDKIVDTYSSEMDFDDLDANSATDSYVIIAWASINGTWPDIELPASLLSISFNVRNHVAFNNSEMTTIGFSSSSTSQGYDFSATDYDLQIMPMNWDFDSNGTADALTDGLLLLRHAFGIAGSSLTDDAIATDSQMSTAEVENALDMAMMIADIDSSGHVDALTDGLLLLRYLFGIREDTLIANAVSTAASRTSHSDISDYIDSYMPNAVMPGDSSAPQITLNGDATYPLALGDNYIELGANAADDRDGFIDVTVSGVVSNSVGNYDVTYTATDEAGNSNSITRTVIVDVAPTIDSFKFLSANNAYLMDDITLDFDGNVFSGRIAENIPVNDLVASFEHNGASVSVNQVGQTDGATANDFTPLVEYKVSKSNGVSQTYTVDLTKFTGLPIVNIFTDGNMPIESKDNYITGTVTVDGGRGFEDLNSTIMEIRGRGNSTWGNPKKPYQMKLDSKEEFLDMPKQKKWIFLAEYSDKSLLRNTVAFELGYLSSLDWTPKSEFAEVYINGEYNGTYNVSEKVEEKSARVDIGDEGFLLEKDTNAHGRIKPDDVYFSTTAYQGDSLIVIKSPDIDRVDENDFNYLQDTRFVYISEHINNFENVLFGDNFADPVNGYANFIDVNSFIDWFLINEIAKNVDAMSFSSIYFTHIPGEKIKMGPLWDFDLGFGNMDYGDPEFTEGWHIRYHAWINRLLDDPAFVTQVQDRFTNHYLANKQYILDKIDEQAELLKWSQQENFNTWQILGVYVWPNPIVWDTYDEEVLYLKMWFEERMNWIEANIGSI
jgi:beta-glucanase (GH16 family)